MDQKEISKKAKYDIQYAKDNLKRVPLDLKKADYERLKAVADRKNEKVNTYIKKAIAIQLEKDENEISS